MRHPFLEVHPSDPHACLARLKGQLIDGADVPNEAAKVGTTVHRVAQAVAEAKAKSAFVAFHQVAAQAIREQAKALRMSAAGILDATAIVEKCFAEDSRVALYPRMGWTGKAELRWGLVEEDGMFTYVEEPTEECAAGGTIDLAEWNPSKVAVTDYKTTIQMWSGTDAYESFQIRLYVAAMLRKVPTARGAEGRFALLRHGYYANADFERGDAWEMQTLAQVRAEREARRNALETGEFPETPGVDCHWCPLLLKCETAGRFATMGAQAAGLLSPTDAARAWLASKAMAARLERFVRKYVEDSGAPIPLDDAAGTYLGFKETNGLEVLDDYETVMDRLRDYGMKEAQFVEHFRFVGPQHYASRVKKVLYEVLGVDPETAERTVVPVTKSEFTTFVPQLAPIQREATDEEIEAMLDGRFDAP